KEGRPSQAKPTLPERARERATPLAGRFSLTPFFAVALGATLLAGAGAGVWWYRHTKEPNTAVGPVIGSGQAPADRPATEGGGTPGVSIQDTRGVRMVQAPKYEAFVEADGCLTSLRTGGAEFLRTGGKVHGGYFMRVDGTPLRLATIDEPNP